MSHPICLSPDDTENRFRKLGIPVEFTPEEKEQFQTTPVVESDYRVFGFPMPASYDSINLFDLKAICGTDPKRPPSFFDHPWYYNETFMTSRCAPGWHFIHMDVLPDSIEQPQDYVVSYGGFLELPSAIEVTLMLFLHFAGTGEQLLHKKHTWCSDEASLGRSVTVGAFGRNGLFVSAHPPVFSSRGLGICGKIRQPMNVSR